VKNPSMLNGKLSGKEIVKVLRKLTLGIHSRVEDTFLEVTANLCGSDALRSWMFIDRKRCKI